MTESGSSFEGGNKNQKRKIEASSSMVLAREIRALEPELMPSRDLWSGIERNISQYPQVDKRTHSRNWMPYGIAASLLLAVSALMLNIVNLNSEQMNIANRQGAGLAVYEGQQALNNMQVEYVKVRRSLIDQFRENNKSLGPETMDNLFQNIDIMEKARLDIEAQIRLNPEDLKLVQLLMKVHEQEIDLLKQDFSKPNRFL